MEIFDKKQLQEIIDSDIEIIGSDDTPQNGSNLETQASNTTDYNASVSHQPYRYDMLGRFGFTLLPFFEGEGESSNNLIKEELTKSLHEAYCDLMREFYKNPNSLKMEYRRLSNEGFELNEKSKAHDLSKRVVETLTPHLDEMFNSLNETLRENVNESSFIEGKMLEKKNDDDLATKKISNDLRDDNAEKIVDLIKKLDKETINKVVNLLEVDNE